MPSTEVDGSSILERLLSCVDGKCRPLSRIVVGHGSPRSQASTGSSTMYVDARQGPYPRGMRESAGLLASEAQKLSGYESHGPRIAHLLAARPMLSEVHGDS